MVNFDGNDLNDVETSWTTSILKSGMAWDSVATLALGSNQEGRFSSDSSSSNMSWKISSCTDWPVYSKRSTDLSSWVAPTSVPLGSFDKIPSPNIFAIWLQSSGENGNDKSSSRLTSSSALLPSSISHVSLRRGIAGDKNGDSRSIACRKSRSMSRGILNPPPTSSRPVKSWLRDSPRRQIAASLNLAQWRFDYCCSFNSHFRQTYN